MTNSETLATNLVRRGSPNTTLIDVAVSNTPIAPDTPQSLIPEYPEVLELGYITSHHPPRAFLSKLLHTFPHSGHSTLFASIFSPVGVSSLLLDYSLSHGGRCSIVCQDIWRSETLIEVVLPPATSRLDMWLVHSLLFRPDNIDSETDTARFSEDRSACPINVQRVDINLKVAIASDIGSDLLIMLLPLSLLMKARISTKQKIGLACMFSLGLIVIAFAFVRFREIKEVSSLNETDEIVLVQGPVRLALWSQIEAAMALLITNIPAKFMDKLA
ncbi:predicted protein [Histoplasma capsulatum H143]|uniref:Rhodopsin domain-containing protein n=1 Tax=Ajellomyces capsulatus (strain H143) TaxID=544712 RepID=C6H5Q1_AJECH|nr:predicted protein [Histoplasma capsulatum H143]